MNTILAIVFISFLAAALYNQFVKPTTGHFIWLALTSGVTYYFFTHVTLDPGIIQGALIGGGIFIVMALIRDAQKSKSPKA